MINILLWNDIKTKLPFCLTLYGLLNYILHDGTAILHDDTAILHDGTVILHHDTAILHHGLILISVSIT